MKVSELKLELDALSVQINVRFAEVDTHFAEVDARFTQVDARFAQVDARFAQIEARIVDEGETTRRHFDVVAESMRSEIRSVLASIAAAHQRLDENHSEHGTFTGILDEHELRLKALEHYRPR